MENYPELAGIKEVTQLLKRETSSLLQDMVYKDKLKRRIRPKMTTYLQGNFGTGFSVTL